MADTPTTGVTGMCPHCGEIVRVVDGLTVTHDWPKPTRQVCPGSWQNARCAESDGRPLWNGERNPHYYRNQPGVCPNCGKVVVPGDYHEMVIGACHVWHSPPVPATAQATRCHDCHVEPGQPHVDGCDVARCTVCGFQRISCSHGDSDEGWGQVWTGRWPGDLEVEEGLATDLNDLASRALFGMLEWNGERWVAPS